MTPVFRIAILALTLFSPLAPAKEVGAELPAWTLEDSSGTEHTLDGSVLRVYANAGRASDKLIKAALGELKQAALDAQNAIAIAEISAAPGFVKRIIKSSLKDRPYTTWVDSAGTTRSAIPYRDGRITILDLKDRQITAISYVNDVDSLKAELSKTLAKPAPAVSPTPAAAAE